MKSELAMDAIKLEWLGEASQPSSITMDEPIPYVRRVRAWLIVICLIIPVFACVLYNFVIATPRYASELTFVVRSIDSSRERISISNISQSSITADNSEIIVNYINSRDILHAIDNDEFVRDMFSSTKVDFFSAFPSLVAGRSWELFHRHFLGYVDAKFNRATNITSVAVQGFTPRQAQLVAQRILAASEYKVNQLNQRIRANLVEGAEKELAAASANLSHILGRLASVRDESAILEPKLQSGAAIKLASAAASELTAVDVQLAQTIRVAPKSPLISQLQARRAALATELGRQTALAAGGPASLAARMKSYEALDAEREIGEKRLMAASLSLVKARESAGKQQLYISRISEPSLADEALYPRAWRNLLLTFVICGALAWIAISLAEVVFGDD